MRLLSLLESGAAGHATVFPASGVLVADARSDIVYEASVLVLVGDTLEPWASIHELPPGRIQPDSVGDDVVILAYDPDISQNVCSPQTLPKPVIRIRQLAVVIKVAAAPSAPAALEMFHPGLKEDTASGICLPPEGTGAFMEDTAADPCQKVNRGGASCELGAEQFGELIRGQETRLSTGRVHQGKAASIFLPGDDRFIPQDQLGQCAEQQRLGRVLPKVPANGIDRFSVSEKNRVFLRCVLGGPS